MNYAAALDFLYSSMPAFHNKGAGAYKPGLGTTLALSTAFGNPHLKLKCIHIAGTNGKGSTAHSLAAVLTAAGRRTALYTSPHLVDFRERMRIDGVMISKAEVVDFVERYRSMGLGLQPSFFELTTIMAFDFFARHGVDIAVVETGLGGRLDSTNIITPLLSVITNISLDHTALLGDTPAAIAGEKAGIIKPGVPAVVGEADDPAVRSVFERKAAECGSPVTFAAEAEPLAGYRREGDMMLYPATSWGPIESDLTGDCQPRNMRTILTALRLIGDIPPAAVATGLRRVAESTGLMGRWMKLQSSPDIICDTGHNTGGWQYIASRLAAIPGRKHIVFGMVADKDVTAVLAMLAQIPDARYYLTQATVERAMPVDTLAALAAEAGITGERFPSVVQALDAAKAAAAPADTIFVGGSTFIVADLLAARPAR